MAKNDAGFVSLENNYFQCPNSIFDSEIIVNVYEQESGKGKLKWVKRTLRGTEKIVYIYLCRCSNGGKKAFPSYDTIAERCGISRRKAIDAVKILEDNGFIDKIVRTSINSNLSNSYRVNNPK